MITYSRYDFGFLARPGVLIILCVIVASIFYPAVSRRFRRRASEAGS